jgi:ADP-ribose pyrophosphatase YjhB (NUDIX family)
LTVNGLVAADEVIIPMQCEYYSLEGLSQLLATLDLVRQNLGHPISVRGILLTMYDKRERLSRDVARELRRRAPYPVFDVEIPRAVALAEAPSEQRPIALYAPQSPGAIAYDRLARELIAHDSVVVTDTPMATSPEMIPAVGGDSVRAVIIEGGEALLMRRERQGAQYWVFPGGHVGEGETAHDALAREVLEETGIVIRIVDVLAAERAEDGTIARWYVCERVSGVPGTGQGPEFLGAPEYASRGTYTLESAPLSELSGMNVVPRRIRDLVIERFGPKGRESGPTKERSSSD